MLERLINAAEAASAAAPAAGPEAVAWAMLARAVRGEGPPEENEAVMRLAGTASFRARRPDRFLRACVLLAGGFRPARVARTLGEDISFHKAQKMRARMGAYLVDALERQHGVSLRLRHKN